MRQGVRIRESCVGAEIPTTSYHVSVDLPSSLFLSAPCNSYEVMYKATFIFGRLWVHAAQSSIVTVLIAEEGVNDKVKGLGEKAEKHQSHSQAIRGDEDGTEQHLVVSVSLVHPNFLKKGSEQSQEERDLSYDGQVVVVISFKRAQGYVESVRTS